MKQLMIGLAVAIVVVLGAYFLVRPTNAPQTTPAVEVTPAESLEVTPEASPTASPEATGKEATEGSSLEGDTITLNMADLKFDPLTTTVKAGKSYKLTLVSKGPHTYTVDKLGINFVVASGETKTFDLKVDKKGTYDVYCATPGHKDAGMVGELVVQ